MALGDGEQGFFRVVFFVCCSFVFFGGGASLKVSE